MYLPPELLMLIFRNLSVLAPPGWKGLNGLIVPFLGWLLMSQVNVRWRGIAMLMYDLWGDAFMAFSSIELNALFLQRSAGRSINLNFDWVLASSNNRDRTKMIKWVFDNADMLLPRAKTFTCTLAPELGVVARFMYHNDTLLGTRSLVAFLLKLDTSQSQLTELTLSVNYSLQTFPRLPFSLRKLSLVQANATPHCDRSPTRPRLVGFYTAARNERDARCCIFGLQSALHSAPNLRKLVMDEVFPQRESGDQRVVDPVEFPSLDIVMATSHPISLEILQKHLVTPRPWEIITSIKDFTWLPPWTSAQSRIDGLDVMALTSRLNHVHVVQSSYEQFNDQPDTLSSYRTPTLARDRYRMYDFHTHPSHLTWTWHSYNRTLPRSPSLVLKLLFITAHPMQRAIVDPACKYKTIFAAIKSVEEIIVEDESQTSVVVENLPCPLRVTVFCQEDWNGRSGVEVLLQGLENWIQKGGNPQSVVVKGCRRASDSELLLSTAMGMFPITDSRTISETVSTL